VGLRIVEVEAMAVRIPLDDYWATFEIAHGASRRDTFIIVKLHTNEGITGYGEAAPHSGFSEETPESVLSALNGYIGPALADQDPMDIEGLVRRLNLILWGNSFAKAAVEMAAWDVVGKALGVPVYRLLGGKLHTSFTSRTGTVGISSPQEAADKARSMVERGATDIKVKIGSDPVDDFERLKAIRKTIGSDVTLRVDANQGYSREQALRALSKMYPLDLDLVEQPVAARDLEGMAAVRGLGFRVMADESAYTPEDAIRIVKAEAADVINLKLAKHGGLLNARKICAIAEAAGLTCGIANRGQFLDRAAALHLAAASPAVTQPNVLPQFFPRSRDTLLVEPLQTSPHQIEVPEGPGLGVRVDEEKLRQYTVSLIPSS
jgi:muconate cycloisomerase